MAKRIVTKIGDIFCVEVDNAYKRYFQYFCNDVSQLNSSVIRVFKKRYPMDSNPKLEEIVSDEVDFYAHTVLKVGIEEKAWSKYGNTKLTNIEKAQEVLFGTVSSVRMSNFMDTEEVNPLDNWSVWHINCPVKKIGRLPESLQGQIELGSVFPFDYIVERIKYGYYRHTSPVFDVIRRHPHPDAESYVRREEADKTVFLHFMGTEPIEMIIVKDGCQTGFYKENPSDFPEFGGINWTHRDFISEEEFRDVFKKYISIK